MPYTDTLKIININCNTIDIHGTDSADNCSENTVIFQSSRHVQYYTNIMQEDDRAEKCYKNTGNISELENKEKPMIIEKEPNTINYFLPGPNQDNDKRVSAKITHQL